MTAAAPELAERVAGAGARFFATGLGLVAGKVASLGVGFLFWVLAARAASVRDVGLAAGAVSLMMLGTQLAIAGAGSAFILSHACHRPVLGRLLDTAITLVALLSAAAASVALAVVWLGLQDLRPVAADPVFAALFLAMTVFGTLGILFDHVSVAFAHGEHVLVRNVLGGLLTAAPLLVTPLLGIGLQARHLFGLWVLGGVVTCAVAAVQLAHHLPGYRYRPGLDRGLVTGLLRTGLPNHALTLVERAPNLLLPVVVTEVLSPQLNAYWYVAWMMAWAVLVVPVSMGVTLLARVADGAGALRRDVLRAGRVGLGLGACAAACVALLAPPVLAMLGPQYPGQSAGPLRILLLALPPVLVLQLYYAVCRSSARLPEALLSGSVTGIAAVLVTAAAAGRHGLVGMAIAWVAVQAGAGLWALVRLVAVVPARSPGHSSRLAQLAK